MVPPASPLRTLIATLNDASCSELLPELPPPTVYFILMITLMELQLSISFPLHFPAPAPSVTPSTSNTLLTPQDTPPPSRATTLDPTKLSINLAEIFNAHMSMAPSAEVLKLIANEEEPPEPVPPTLIVKPFGFRIAPPPQAHHPTTHPNLGCKERRLNNS
ncbi:hypothetical protein CRG98_033933 [Punica granatum]|uniref:Uncharacterized protein n=1 Tax=Punica granatum TaxID=22663 RepID=A0A2I0INR5_PUNGR|nr:hypothetical protein CRG98_033933 [Punica granatum]